MSNLALGWAFEQQPSGGALSKLVLVALADGANTEHDETWPSVTTIMRRCQIGRSTVQAHLAKLEQEGFIRRTARFSNNRQTANVYRIMCRPGVADVVDSGVLQRDGPTSRAGGVPTSGAGGAHQPGGEGPTSRAQNPKEEPSTKPTTQPIVASAALALARTDPLPAKPLPAMAKPTGAAVIQRLGVVMAEIADGERTRVTAEQARKLAAGIVFAYWMHKFNHPNALLDPKRERVIVARLEENGGDVSELLHAIDGARNDEWVMGTAPNARHPNDSVDYVLRDRSKVETYANTRRKYRDGKPHELAAKYAAVIRGEEEPPATATPTPAGESRHTQDAEGSNGRADEATQQMGTRNAAGAGTH